MTTETFHELETLRTEALAACRKARATSNGNWLLDVHDAGARLEAIPPQRGRRSRKQGLTNYESVLRDAKISRPTANLWKKVGRIGRAFVESYVAEMGHDATIVGLLEAYDPSEKEAGVGPKRSLPLGEMSDVDYAFLKDRLNTLPRSFYTPKGSSLCGSRGEALAKILRIYEEELKKHMISERTAA